MNKLYREYLFLGLLLFYNSSVAAGEMFVRDTAFCRSVIEHKCIGVLPHDSNVNISSLPIVEGHRRLYFWGNLRNPSENAVGFYFSRKGDCYQDGPINIDDRALDNITFTDNVIGFLTSITMREVWHTLGFSEGEVGVKDISVNVSLIPEANKFRIHHYRFILCAGEYRARLIDSNGNPIPGNNEIKLVLTN